MSRTVSARARVFATQKQTEMLANQRATNASLTATDKPLLLLLLLLFAAVVCFGCLLRLFAAALSLSLLR